LTAALIFAYGPGNAVNARDVLLTFSLGNDPRGGLNQLRARS